MDAVGCGIIDFTNHEKIQLFNTSVNLKKGDNREFELN